jgi:hypothetical protein
MPANVLGMLLGTAFRYWAYKRFVFTSTADDQPAVEPATSTPAGRRSERVGTPLPGRVTNVTSAGAGRGSASSLPAIVPARWPTLVVVAASQEQIM